MKILTFSELKTAKGIPYTREHLRRLVNAGKFPQPIELGEARIGWIEEEVDDYLQKRADARAVVA
jgi:prophage regulatory protein